MKEQEKYIIISVGGSGVNNLPANVRSHRKHGFDPWVVRSPGKGTDNPLQYFCLKNPTDRGAWWATVHKGRKESDATEWLSTQQERNSSWPLRVKTLCPTKANKTYQDTKSWITKLGIHSFMRTNCFSHVWLLLWIVACQTLLFMGFSGQEYWSGLPCPPPEELPPQVLSLSSSVSCLGRLVLHH